MFWKKSDDFSDLGLGDEDSMEPLPGEQSDINQDMNLGPTGGFNQQDLGFNPNQSRGYQDSQAGLSQQRQSFGQENNYGRPQSSSQSPNYINPVPQQSGPSHNDAMMLKNMEVISSKLDALRVSIDSVNQRLANLERMASGENYNKNDRNW